MFRLLVLAVGACLVCCGRWGFDNETPADACAVTLAPTAARANYNSEVAFVADGGRPPYAYDLDAGPGALAADGVFTAGDQAGTVMVTARDSFGCVAQASIEVGGDSLFYVGGTINAVPTAQVLRSDDGENWTPIGALPAARSTGALLVVRDRMYWISGTGAAPATDVYASSDGVTWTEVGDVPVAATSFGNTVRDGVMWMVGGNGNTGAVTSSTDGVTWTPVGSLPMDNHGGSLSVLNGNLIYAGGHNGSLFDWVLSSATGASWTQIGTLPAGREYHRAIVIDQTLWLVGGQDTTPTPLPLVTSTTNGTAFMTNPALPAGRPFGGLAFMRGELWSVGGSDGGGVWSSTPGGAWQMHGGTFTARQGGGLVAFTPR